MFLGTLASVILAVILSFFNVDTWVMQHIIPDFLAQYGTIIYYAAFASIGAVIGYFGKH